MAPTPERAGSDVSVALREYRSDDLEALEEYWTPAVRRWLPGIATPGDRRSVADALARYLTADRQHPSLSFDVVAEAGGTFIGTGRVTVRDELNANGDIGYTLREQLWGRGYGTLVARALIDVGFTRLGLHRVWATVHPEKAASVRVLEKAGMTYEGRLRDDRRMPERWCDPLLFAVIRDDRALGVSRTTTSRS